ncbi:hypothetical protein Tco_1252169 [Tanacetum coccineum]
MEPDICYTRFLSLIFKKLLGRDYVSNDLTLVKPHTITTASFQKLLASEVPLTSHMLKVAKLSEEPEQSLIPPSREINADDPANKSLSRASKKVVETQHAEVTVATTDAAQSLDAFESAEEQVNQSTATEAEKANNNLSQTSLRESDEVKGYPRPNRESESALNFPYILYTLCLHSGDDTERLKMPDV